MNDLAAARAALSQLTSALPSPANQHESGRIDGLLEAAAFLSYFEDRSTGRIPAHVTFDEWSDPDAGWR